MKWLYCFSLTGMVVGAACDDDTPSRRPTLDARGTMLRDIQDEHRRHRDELIECHQVVADTYRKLGMGNRRVTFQMRLNVRAARGVGLIDVRGVDAPNDVPAQAKECLAKKFPKQFAARQDFSGELPYEMCLFVLPEPLNG